ncbi:MAG: hypothetical protein IKL10_01515 [Clostridia bacterium]|nr:hypothetical protein [Clostridia bacterium]
MNAKKILALALMVIMVFTCSACTTIELVIPVGNVPAVNTGANTDTAPSQTTPEATTQAPVQTTPEATTQAPVQTTPEVTTQAPVQTTPEETTQAPAASTGMPSSKEEVIKYYCDAYNKMATEAKSVTRTYDNTTNYKGILNINNNSTLQGLASSLMTQFMKENTEQVAFTVADLPPEGHTTINIDPSLLSSATCTDKGDYYEIVLKSTGTDDNYEVDSKPLTGSAGSIGPLLDPEDVSSAAAGVVKFDGLHAWYATCTTTVKVDKATGRITDFEFNSPCILHFDQVTALGFIKVQNCDIGLLFQPKYTIAY